MKPVQITLDKSHIDTVVKFTQNEDCEWYKKSRKASNAHLDIILGKLGELALSIMLRQYKVIVYPNFQHYKIKDKKFDADLGQNLHCKTCSLATRLFIQQYNRTDLYSWVFQHTDKLIHNAFAYEKELIGLVYLPYDHKNSDYLDLPNITLEIVSIMPWKILYPMLEDPVLTYKRGYKYAIYSNHAEFQKYLKKHYWSKVIKKIKPTYNHV